MKITVINGNTRHGSTWHCMDLILQELAKYDAVEKTEIILPKDLPEFCRGCFSCFLNGEDTCPHAGYVAPIVKAVLDADLIILSSPVYGMDVTGQMKAFIDHLCFMWVSHRPNPDMFTKIGLTVTTTAGAGLRHTAKTLRNCLSFWGVRKTYSFKKAVSALKWDDVSEKKQAQIKAQAKKLAKKLVFSVKNVKTLPKPLIISLMFKMLSGAMKKNAEWNPRDKNYWEAHGWLSGVKPF